MLQTVEQGLGQVLGAISQAGIIIKMLQAHYGKVVAPLLEDAPPQAQQCSKGFAAMLRGTAGVAIRGHLRWWHSGQGGQHLSTAG